MGLNGGNGAKMSQNGQKTVKNEFSAKIDKNQVSQGNNTDDGKYGGFKRVKRSEIVDSSDYSNASQKSVKKLENSQNF